MSIIAYMRTTQQGQDLKNQMALITEYARKHQFQIDEFIEAESLPRRGSKTKRIGQFLENIKENETLIISELSRLGRSTSEIIDLVNALIKRRVRLIAVKQNLDISNTEVDMNTGAAISFFSMLSDLEKDIALERTKMAVSTRKKGGKPIGKPKGYIGKSKLDGKDEYVRQLLDKKVGISTIARILSTSRTNLVHYIRTRNIGLPKTIQVKPLFSKKMTMEKPPVFKEDKELYIDTYDKPKEFYRNIEEERIDKKQLLCRRCGKDINDAKTLNCVIHYVEFIDHEPLQCLPYPANESDRCQGCGAQPGSFHHEGCYMERCPRCGQRLVSCGCKRIG